MIMWMPLDGLGCLFCGRRLALLCGLSFVDVSQDILVDYLYIIVSTCLWFKDRVLNNFFVCTGYDILR